MQKVAGSNLGSGKPTTGKLCQASSKWVPFSGKNKEMGCALYKLHVYPKLHLTTPTATRIWEAFNFNIFF